MAIAVARVQIEVRCAEAGAVRLRRRAWCEQQPARVNAARDKGFEVIVGNAAEFVDDLRKIRPGLTVIKAADLDLDSAGLVKAEGG